MSTLFASIIAFKCQWVAGVAPDSREFPSTSVEHVINEMELN